MKISYLKIMFIAVLFILPIAASNNDTAAHNEIRNSFSKYELKNYSESIKSIKRYIDKMYTINYT